MSGSYPSPTFDALTLNSALPVGSGGTGATTVEGIAGAISANFYVATIATLRALTSATTATTASVSGYAAAGDGGGGIFVVDAADTTSTDNGGTIIVDAAGRRWYRVYSGRVNVLWFGAKGDGTTDDTAAFNAALAVGAVFIPAKTFSVSTFTAASNVNILGEGSRASVISTSSATGDVLTCNGSFTEIRGVQFTASVARTSGAYATVNTDSTIEDVYCDKWFTGLNLRGNVGTVRTAHFGGSPASTSSVAVYVDGYAGGLVLDDIMTYAPAGGVTPAAGIQIVNSGDVIIANSNIIEQNVDLLINPGSGQGVSTVWAVNSFFDNAITNGLQIGPSGTGNVTRCKFTSCWFSSCHTGAGVTVTNAGTGTVAGIEFENCTAILNASHGLNIGAVTDIAVNGGVYAGNSGYGIAINATSFNINGARVGAYAGVSGNTSGGIIVVNTSLTDGVIEGCRLKGNTGNPINFAAGVANLSIANCAGYNPTGIQGVAVPASGTPLTNPVPYQAAIAISGGTVTAIDVDGTATGLTSGTIILGVGQTITLTYSVAPTWVWNGIS